MELVRDKTKQDTLPNYVVLNMFRRGEFRKDHPLQRKADQWDAQTRDGFIATVVKGEDFDSIKICEQIAGPVVELWLVDGLQKMTNIEKYKSGVFKLGKNIEYPIIQYQSPLKDEQGVYIRDASGRQTCEVRTFDLRGKGYADLPEELKDRFDSCPVNVIKHLDCDDEEIGYHIRRYNRGKAMNNSQTSITYMENVARYVKDITRNHRFFSACGKYTANERKNGTLDKIVAESVMAMFHLSEWQKQSRKMGAFLNQHAAKEEFDTFARNLDRLSKVVIGPVSEMFNSKNSFLWFALFERFKRYENDDRKFVLFMEAFADRLRQEIVPSFGLSYDELDHNRATKDKSVITRKLDMLEELMRSFFQVDEGADVDLAAFICENVGVDPAALAADMDLYRDSLEDLLDNTVRMGSKLRDAQNRASMLAMVAYSYQKDVDLEDWLMEYAGSHDTYLADQHRNYSCMKESLGEYHAGGTEVPEKPEM